MRLVTLNTLSLLVLLFSVAAEAQSFLSDAMSRTLVGASYPVQLSYMSYNGAAKVRTYSLLGFAAEIYYRLTNEIEFAATYELNSSGKNILFRGPTAQLDYFLIGTRPFNSTTSEHKVTVRYPFAIFLYGGIVSRDFDFREFLPDTKSVITQTEFDVTGSFLGPQIGIGLIKDFSPTFGMAARAQGAMASATGSPKQEFVLLSSYFSIHLKL
jgi:hypothetical protein